MDDYHCPHRSKIEQPRRVFCPQIYAAVTHWCPEVVVPVRPVKSVTLEKIHDVRNIREEIIISGHVRRTVFDVDLKIANDGNGRPASSRDHETPDRLASLHCISGL